MVLDGTGEVMMSGKKVGCIGWKRRALLWVVERPDSIGPALRVVEIVV